MVGAHGGLPQAVSIPQRRPRINGYPLPLPSGRTGPAAAPPTAANLRRRCA
ncbi:hypothetical protein BV133_1239 [Blastochloris viridis]|uniref:Uncharacterized protein n=1 Tax=Blastochloris viridis TaxID=1079 RepID=A0A182D243_BLAVI|nr:hypothetical protein BV133_1239 [Blastochloris viridis]